MKKPKIGQTYYTVTIWHGDMTVTSDIWDTTHHFCHLVDLKRWRMGLVFLTEKEARAKIRELKKFLKK